MTTQPPLREVEKLMEITIELKNSKQLENLESLFLTLGYSPEHVDRVKKLKVRRFIMDTKEWEVPISLLKEIQKDFADCELVYINFEPKELLKKRKNHNLNQQLFRIK